MQELPLDYILRWTYFNMQFSTRNKFLFLAIPKTASTSIRHALKNYSDHINFRHFNHLIKYDTLHIDQSVAKQIFSEAGIHLSKNTLEFVFVRNPYDKLCSQINYVTKSRYTNINFDNVDEVLDVYENVIHRNKWFDNDIRFYNFCPQNYWTKNPIFENFKVFKVEEIDKAWTSIRNELNLDLPDLSVHNKSQKSIELTQSQRDRAYDIFKEDFQLFGYDK